MAFYLGMYLSVTLRGGVDLCPTLNAKRPQRLQRQLYRESNLKPHPNKNVEVIKPAHCAPTKCLGGGVKAPTSAPPVSGARNPCWSNSAARGRLSHSCRRQLGSGPAAMCGGRDLLHVKVLSYG